MVWPLVAARSGGSPDVTVEQLQPPQPGAGKAAPPLWPAPRTQGSTGGVPATTQTCFCSPGMEVAAYLAERAHSVSLVELEEVPFKKFFGERVGRAVMKVTSLSHQGGGFGDKAGSAYCSN